MRMTKDGYSAIGRARVADARAVTALLHAAYAEHLAAGLNFSAGSQNESQTTHEIREREVYGIRRKTALVASVTLGTQTTRTGTARIYVNHLAVAPSARNAGLGARLLDHAERVARRRRTSVLRLDTATRLPALIERYRRRGFHVIGERQWKAKTYRSVLMEKVLEYRRPSDNPRSAGARNANGGRRWPRF